MAEMITVSTVQRNGDKPRSLTDANDAYKAQIVGRVNSRE